MHDINSKVAIFAMENCPDILSIVGPLLNEAKGVQAEMLKALMAQLPSKSEEIRSLAKECLEAMVDHIGEWGSSLKQLLYVRTQLQSTSIKINGLPSEPQGIVKAMIKGQLCMHLELGRPET